ncbi:MAG TPA: MFS transporter [Geobacterales bacterium]|nr:MFS transporter [Geobacterales bacterium]
MNISKKIGSQALMIILGTFIPSVAIGMVNTDIAYYFTTLRGFPTTFSGLLFTLEGLSAILLSIPFGIFSDRYGRKRFILLGSGLIGTSIALIALAENEILLYFIAIFLGLADASLTASLGAMLADYSNENNRTLIFSISSFANTAAFGLGGLLLLLNIPLVSVGFSDLDAHILLYISLSLGSLASLVILFRIPEKRISLNSGIKLGFVSKPTLNLLIKYSTANLFIAFGAGLFVPLMSQWFKFKYNVSDVLSGPILGISSILVAASQLVAPIFARRLGLVKAIVVTQALSTVFLVATPIPTYFFLSAIFYIIRSFMMNAANPLSNSLIMGIVKEEERGITSSITAIFWRIPNAISTYIGSFLLEIGLLDLPFYFAAILYLISIYMFWLWFRSFNEKR